MERPAAIRGTFADFRLIKSRKIAQLVVEIPIEEADAALTTLGGLPQPAAERWVALAILNTAKHKEKEKRPFTDLKAVMQAGIICNEPSFWHFCRESFDETSEGSGVVDEETAARFVRSYCGISSRSGLNDNPVAFNKWRKLRDLYFTWKREPLYA